jgi:hypothetical protein
MLGYSLLPRWMPPSARSQLAFVPLTDPAFDAILDGLIANHQEVAMPKTITAKAKRQAIAAIELADIVEQKLRIIRQAHGVRYYREVATALVKVIESGVECQAGPVPRKIDRAMRRGAALGHSGHAR